MGSCPMGCPMQVAPVFLPLHNQPQADLMLALGVLTGWN